MPAQSQLGDVLAALLPSGVALSCGDGGEPSELYPEEAALVAQAVEKRRREFACGRACARRALALIGVAPVAIPIGPRRAPSWPPGIVGSVTHTAGFCAAAVATRDACAGLGIDAEPDVPLAPELVRRVSEPAELSAAAGLKLDAGTLGHLVFSAKEAVYKCQFPETGEYLGFGDVRLELAAETFVGVLKRAVGPFSEGHAFSGRWRRGDGLIFTAAFRAADPAGPAR